MHLGQVALCKFEKKLLKLLQLPTGWYDIGKKSLALEVYKYNFQKYPLTIKGTLLTISICTVISE